MISIPIKYFVEKPQNSEYSRYMTAHIVDSQYGYYSGYYSFNDDEIPNSNQMIPLFLYAPS